MASVVYMLVALNCLLMIDLRFIVRKSIANIQHVLHGFGMETALLVLQVKGISN